MTLPKPTTEELDLGMKVEYFGRIVDLDFDKKYSIDFDDLCDWISHNYNSVFLFGEELNYNQYKKLKK
jgi:hypothetical protein